MTNEEKALEIVNTSTLRDPVDGFGIALKMAEWKDKQFHETLKRANESVTKAHEEGARIERERIIEKACEWLKKSITNNPETNRIIPLNGTVTMGMLIEDFKNYMKGE